MAGFTVGKRLLASQLNTFTPSGDVVAGGKVQATSAQSASDTQLTNGTTGSTTFTATLTGGTACGLTFVAPPSGVVFVTNRCGQFNTTDFSICGFQIRAGGSIGSGTIFQAVDDDHSLISKAANLEQRGDRWRVAGLTPGSTYNAQGLYRVVSGTGNFQRKHLAVEPGF